MPAVAHVVVPATALATDAKMPPITILFACALTKSHIAVMIPPSLVIGNGAIHVTVEASKVRTGVLARIYRAGSNEPTRLVINPPRALGAAVAMPTSCGSAVLRIDGCCTAGTFAFVSSELMIGPASDIA